MPKYVDADLHTFQNPNPLKPQDVTQLWNRPTYRAATHYADLEDNSAPLPPYGITTVTKIVGRFLYYDLTVDYKMLFALSNLTATQ